MSAWRALGAVRVGVVVMAGAALAACATVPTSGPIEQGPVVDSGESAQFIRVIAAPPSVGAGPREIVRGFLEANASLEANHSIARRYLTPSASENWDPDASTTIYDQASLELSGESADAITATLSVSGRLAADGSLETIDPAETEKQVYQLEQSTEGSSTVPQWRITDPSPGVLISDVDLRRAYRQYQVHFPSERSSVLVPDSRLLPVIGPSLPTALAEQVLAGPSDWLARGVRTGPPIGTELALGAVPVNDGVAVVDLTDQALAATDAQRRDLAAQFTWTLTQIPGVTYVRLRVGGESFNVPGVPELMDRRVWEDWDPDALTTGPQGDISVPYYTLEGSAVVRVAGSNRAALTIQAPEADALTDLGVSLDQRTAAAVSADRSTLWVIPLDSSADETWVEGGDLSGPSFDVDGRAWFTDEGRVMRLASRSQAQEVPTRSEGFTAKVSSVHLARDGVRVLLVAGGELHLGVIYSQGDDVVIGSVHRIATSVTGVLDATWRDSVTIDVLGPVDSRGLQVLRVDVGSGQAQQLGAPPVPQEVAGAPGTPTLVSTEEGELFGNVGLQWREQGPARSVAYPG